MGLRPLAVGWPYKRSGGRKVTFSYIGPKRRRGKRLPRSERIVSHPEVGLKHRNIGMWSADGGPLVTRLPDTYR